MLGAGFNLNANDYLSTNDRYQTVFANACHNPPLQWEREPLPCFYPKVDDLLRACFGPAIGSVTSAEMLFSQAYKRANWVPLKRLVAIIQAADHYIASRIIDNPSTPYRKFFQYFQKSRFLSYNYDCLAELHLQRLQQWNPQYGFGIEAECSQKQVIEGQNTAPQQSKVSVVLHLHGSLYLYPIETDISPADTNGTRWLTLRSSPRFIFDPDTLCDAFPAFARPELNHAYSPPTERIIPPINDKDLVLEQAYYEIVMRLAHEYVQEADRLIAIGYSFSEQDKQSYDTLLKGLFRKGKELILINPSADKIAHQISSQYCSYSPLVTSLRITFSDWVAKGFPEVLHESNH